MSPKEMLGMLFPALFPDLAPPISDTTAQQQREKDEEWGNRTHVRLEGHSSFVRALDRNKGTKSRKYLCD